MSGRTRKPERNKKAAGNPSGLPDEIFVGVNPIFLFSTPRSRSCLDQFSCAVREIVFPYCRKFRRHQGTGAIKKTGRSTSSSSPKETRNQRPAASKGNRGYPREVA